jgi:uncharacterized protein
MAHPNVDIVRDGYGAFERGDLDTLQNHFFAPDITWHYAGRSELSGDYHGVEKVIDWLSRCYELAEGSLAIELHDVVGNQEHVVALITLRATRSGKELADGTAQIFHMQDGKATEVWTRPGDQYATDEFWS